MKKAILAKKLGMTQLIDESGQVFPITVAQIEEAVVLSKKSLETDKYESIVVAYSDVKESRCNKPHLGVFKKLNQTAKKKIKELRLVDCSTYNVGDLIGTDVFEEKEMVNVRSKSIGRGFTGTIKRWNFHRGPMAHGSKSHRIPGSIGAGTSPSKVVKGKHMSGHYGDETVTIKNLKVYKIDKTKKLILIVGSVPGKKNNLIEIYN